MTAPEFRTPWRKSSYSDQAVNCIELALREDIAGIRDSKNPGAGHLTVGATAFRSLLNRAKRS